MKKIMLSFVLLLSANIICKEQSVTCHCFDEKRGQDHILGPYCNFYSPYYYFTTDITDEGAEKMCQEICREHKMKLIKPYLWTE